VLIIESIRDNLQDDETIKWYEIRVLNYRRRFYLTQIFIFFILSGFICLIGLFFWYVPSWTGTFYFWNTDIIIPPIFIYLSILSIFIAIAIIAFIYSVILFKKDLKESELNFSDLNPYELIYCITNKHWIQKDFNSLSYFNETNLPDTAFLKNRDIIYIKLQLVDRITIKKGLIAYLLTFYFERNDYDLNENFTFQVKLKVKDYEGLIRSLSQATSIEILKD
jgi:hypothetical protein